MADESNVVALKGVMQSSAKAAWLDQVAQAWDDFTEQTGMEPEHLFLIQLSHNGEGVHHRTNWIIGDAARGFGTRPLVLYAGEMLKKEATDPA